MTLAEIRELCEAAKRPWPPPSPPSSDGVTMERVPFSTWRWYLLNHGEELLAVAEAASSLLGEDGVREELSAYVAAQLLEKALAALTTD